LSSKQTDADADGVSAVVFTSFAYMAFIFPY